ncbi:MAG: twin-arginine translocation signal domain-containing protein, partial [Planctomycetaceae bacterium]|nr:twin-arginine translocation signal domain-containing protein [Planctomycetaceae bacterium]
MNPVQEFQRHITRRELLQGSLAGAGGAALAGLLAKDLSADTSSPLTGCEFMSWREFFSIPAGHFLSDRGES